MIAYLINDCQESSLLVVKVIDEGIGLMVNDNELGRTVFDNKELFKPFAKIERKNSQKQQSGNGFGLYVCK